MSSLHVFVVSIFCSFSLILAQQPYMGLTNSDCNALHNSTSNLGYFCNGQNRSCQSFLTFRSKSPYNSVSSISTLLGSDVSQLSRLNSVDESAIFPTDKLVVVPINCSCSGQFYQANSSYSIRDGDKYISIANDVLQGLSTCQSIGFQNPDRNATNLLLGQTIHIPLRCACPTKNQTDLGFNYLLSYGIVSGDFVSSITSRFQLFGADLETVFQANEIHEETVIFPSTTLLIPLKTQPLGSQINEPPPSPSPPPPPPPVPSPPPSSPTIRTWVYVLIAFLGGIAAVIIIGSVVFFVCIRKRKKKPVSITEPSSIDFESYEKPSDKMLSQDEESSDLLESISEVVDQPVKVYSFKELQDATDDFDSSHLLKGSVYRGTVNGDLAAIKKMNGDVSKEINLMSKINHSSLIRFLGICFNEGHWYLVYQYAANGPLSDWIGSNNRNGNGKFLNWMHRIQIAFDVAAGLHYLHSFTTPPHVHKDVKLDNILLDSDFRGKISNFGLARSAGWQEGEFSVTRHIVGTRGYMAPEYLENGLVSTSLDVYAFGILVMEMLTGKEISELYKTDNSQLHDVIKHVLADQEHGKEHLSNLMDPSMQGNYPLELAVFVMRMVYSCLEKDPSRRPAMEEIVQSLSRTLSSSLSWEMSHNKLKSDES